MLLLCSNPPPGVEYDRPFQVTGAPGAVPVPQLALDWVNSILDRCLDPIAETRATRQVRS